MTEHVAVRATPPGFDYRVDVLPGVYTPGYCMPRLRRFEPYTPPAFRTIHASGVQNHVRLPRYEPCSPSAIRTMAASGVWTMPRLWRSEPCHASGGLNHATPLAVW